MAKEQRVADSKGSFFRQSAWMVMATLLGGVGMTYVHSFVSARLEPNQYGEFKSLLNIFYIVGAPQAAIWNLFAQQTAMAVTPAQMGTIARAARQTALVITGLMALVAAYLFWHSDQLARDLKLESASSLWATWGLILATFLLAICRGVLQGKQDFFFLGWVSILDGLGRAAGVIAMVLMFHAHAAGAITGALIGNIAALGIGLAALSSTVRLRGVSPPWRQWAGLLLPFTVVAAALSLLSQSDLIFLSRIIPADRLDEFDIARRYAPAQILGFALTQFTVPLALVMFPKLARSRATSEKSDALRLTLLTTAVLGGLAALGLTFIPWLPLRILFRTFDPQIASPLVPWLGWGMLAYTLANVLLSNLLAHGRYRVAYGVVFAAACYALALYFAAPAVLRWNPLSGLKLVAGIVGGGSLLLLAIAAWFTRAAKSESASLSGQPASR